MKKNDVKLIIILLVLSTLCLFGYQFVIKQTGSEVLITVDGEIYAKLRLKEEQSLYITGVNGGKNRVLIKDNEVLMVEADCPDLICVHHKAISYQGETIVCLPNRVVLEIIHGENRKIDAVVTKIIEH